jgi:uncharacterized protein (DUF4415 family)
MPTKKKTGESKWLDPDDAPELTKEWFEQADLYRGGKLVRRGRPKAEVTKKLVSLRLDPDVIDRFQRSGPGWQRRINDALRKVAKLKSTA